MCCSVYANDKDVRSVQDFEDYFKVDVIKLGLVHKDSIDGLDKDCCLCQIDLEKYMETVKDKFQYDFGDYFEVVSNTVKRDE